MMFYLNVRDNNYNVEAYITVINTCTYGMLHFNRHYKEIFKEKLTILMSFCCKFVKVYIHQSLFQYKKF